jgi:two-component system phosphate regulon response regulator PhoB
MQSILLIEDSEDFQLLVSKVLDGIPARIVTAPTTERAYSELGRGSFDLILLDVDLPDGSGFDFCARIRQDPALELIPIIFLTGKSEIPDRVRGFSLGADDYIVKPVEPVEFRARLQAKLANIRSGQVNKVLIRGPLKLDFSLQRGLLEGKDLNLTPAEFKILAFLARHDGRSFTGKELLQAIWGSSIHVVDHNLYTHVSALRKKLGVHSGLVRSLPRGGYQFGGS